jgi:hypothetical protein
MLPYYEQEEAIVAIAAAAAQTVSLSLICCDQRDN